jgi:CubicO group peptidase (beta-lactamase class C family)
MKKLLLLLLLTSSIGYTQQTKFQKIDSLLTYLNANNKFMGSLAIRDNDKIVFAKAYGFADVATNKKLDANTKLKIGSITKTFTATMIMQLVDEKKLTINTKLAQFYPKVVNAEKITIHDLLHHRTGIPDYLNADSTIVANLFRLNTRKEMIEKITSYQSIFEPNTKFEYSNSNYYLLGAIIEDITKKSFTDNLNSRIIKKIGLKNTLLPTKTNIANNESYSYLFVDGKWTINPEWDYSLAFAAGAIVATPSDLTQFFTALFNGKLVSENSLELMKTMEDNYGMALIIAPFDGKKFYTHTGGIESFRAVAGYNIEDKLALSLIVNGDNYNRNDIMLGVLNLLYEKPYTFPDLAGITVENKILKNYVGVYSSPNLPLKIQISLEKGKLSAQATGQSSFPLEAKSETEFVFTPAGIQIVFGDKNFELNQGGKNYPFTKE